MDQRVDRELLHRAFELAWFLHRDRSTALSIARAAYASTEVAMRIQDQRWDRLPRHRPTKISFEWRQMLQRRVLVTSQDYYEETRPARSDAEMLVRFLGYLVRKTTSRSYSATVGLCRILYRYSTRETAWLYDLLIQDPERYADEERLRQKKKQVLDVLRKRFGSRIRIRNARRGEQIIQERKDPGGLRDLTFEALRTFRPWETSCVLPERVGADDVLSKFDFRGKDPHQEHPFELRRVHAVICPECLSRLARAHQLEAPADQVKIPDFHLEMSDDPHTPLPRGRSAPPALTDAEYRDIEREIRAISGWRRKLADATFAVTVDGREVARLDSARPDPLRLELDDGADSIDVWHCDDDGSKRIVAAFLVTSPSEPTSNTVVLEGGQEIVFEVRPDHHAIVVELAYQPAPEAPTALVRLVRSLLGARVEPELSRRFLATGFSRITLFYDTTFRSLRALALKTTDRLSSWLGPVSWPWVVLAVALVVLGVGMEMARTGTLPFLAVGTDRSGLRGLGSPVCLTVSTGEGLRPDEALALREILRHALHGSPDLEILPAGADSAVAALWEARDLGETEVRLSLGLRDLVADETVERRSAGLQSDVAVMADGLAVWALEMLGRSETNEVESQIVPHDPDAARLWGEAVAAWQTGDPSGARAGLEEALEIAPAAARAHDLLAAVLLQLNLPDEALEHSHLALAHAAAVGRQERLMMWSRRLRILGEDERAVALAELVWTPAFRRTLDTSARLEWGLYLADLQLRAGRPAGTVRATLDELRSLPAPYGTDPRLDLLGGG